MPEPESAQPDPTPEYPLMEKKNLPETIRSTAAGVSNEALMQSATLYLFARRVLLTSLGALALTLDESTDLLNRLVERGEVAETDIARLVSEYTQRSDAREERDAEGRRATVDKATVALADSVEVILGRLNVPTRTDIDDLSRKIGQLNDKVLALRERSTAAAGATAKEGPAPDAQAGEDTAEGTRKGQNGNGRV